jgi:hypothetical protein
MHRSDGGALWMHRPLSHDLLCYAAHDVHAIKSLYLHFCAAEWLLPSTLPTLFHQSARYIWVHDKGGHITPADIFRRGSLLPLDILCQPAGCRRVCQGCSRHLSIQHFGSFKLCRVCKATELAHKRNMGAQRSERQRIPSLRESFHQ